MKIINDYLSYLNEEGIISKGASWVGKEISSNTRSMFYFTIGIAAITTYIKSLNALFSKATQKCGGRIIKKHTPGFKICVAKERIKILQQQIEQYKKILLKCNLHKNPELCKQKYTLQIEKLKNRIEVNQNTIKSLTGVEENYNIQHEIAPLALAGSAAGFVASTAIGIAIGMAIDKAVRIAGRTAQASFDEATRKCGIYKESNAERNICVSKFKLIALTKKLATLNSLLGKCSKEKKDKQEKCREKVMKHIEKTNRDIQILKDDIIVYTKELENEKREEQIRAMMKAQK